MTEKAYDLLTYGRSSIDLYSNDIGAPFEEITGFGSFAGGSPLNIATGLARLGGKAALLTGMGEDKVADFLLRFLENGVPLACVEVDARGRLFWELNNPEDVARIEGGISVSNGVFATNSSSITESSKLKTTELTPVLNEYKTVCEHLEQSGQSIQFVQLAQFKHCSLK